MMGNFTPTQPALFAHLLTLFRPQPRVCILYVNQASKFMRIFLSTILALTFQLSFISQAEARGVPIIYGTEDALDLVEMTTIPGPNDKPMALCHYTSKYHAFYLGFWRTSHGYALTDDGCAGDTYYDISEAEFKEAQNSGMISADLPSKARMNMGQIASGFAGLGLIALIVLFLLFKVIGGARRKSARKAEMGDIPKAASQILDAMCHAAISDGSVDDSEVVKIAEIAQQMTGETFGAERIRTIVGNASKKPSDNEFKAFGAGLAPDQKELLLKAVFTIIAADGQITESEHEFFIKTAQGMMMDGDTVRRIVDEVQSEGQGIKEG